MYSILIVDDERDLLVLAKDFLEQTEEFHVDTAVSARDALAMPEIRTCDAIVSDYLMPEMDGIIFLKAVRERIGDVPFILFTGRGREDVVIDAINNGADFYLQKGGDVVAQFAELVHKIKQAVARRQAEHSLIESRKRLSDIIGFLPDATLAINRDGIIIAWNRAIEEMTGFPAESMLGKGDHEYAIPFYGKRRPILLDLIFEPDDVILQNYSHIVREKDTLIADTTLPRLQGRAVTLLGKASPLYNSRGEIDGAIESIRDITEMKKADDELRAAYEQISASEEELREQLEGLAKNEQQARESEEKYRTIFETIQDVYYRADADGNMVLASPSILPLFKYDRMDEIIGKNLARDLWFYPERRQAFLDELQKNGSVNNYEVIVRRKDGKALTITTSSHLCYDKEGKVAGVEGILHDITAMREADQQIQLLAGLIEITPASVIVHDPEGRIIYANQRTFDLHGYTREEFMALNLHSIDVPSSEQQINQRIEELRNTGEASFDVEHFRKDGSRLPLHVTAKITRWNGRDVITSVSMDMSDRMEAEKTLFESEERLQLALIGADLGTWNWNIKTGEVVFNDRWAEMLGYQPDEIEPDVKSWERLIHPDDAPLVQELLSAHLDGRTESYECEHRLRHRNGSWIWVMDKGRVIERDDDGRPLLAAGTHLDITQRKLAEDALRESEAKFRRIADNARDMIYRMSLPDGKYEYVSPASLAITGYTPEEFYAESGLVQRLIHPDWQDYYRKQWDDLLEGRVPPTYECQIIDHSGRIHWLNQRNVLVSDERGRPVALEGIVTDITESRQAEEALRENEARYRTIIENIQDGFVRVDTGGGVIMASPSLAHMFGYDAAGEILGMPVQRFYHRPESRQDVLDRIAKEKKISDYEIEFVRKDGSVFWGSLNAQFLFDKNGKVAGTEAVIHDITERRSMEHAIREANRKLGLLNTITRHDVANQLTALQGLAQIASMKKSDPVITDYLTRIITAADTIARQIEFTRTYQELGVKAPAWMDVEDIISHVDSRVPIRFSKTCGGVGIIADPMLERVFFNLIENAVRHGGSVSQVTVRCEREPDGLLIIVEDDGNGIAADEKEKIFERGYGKNTGLGLFLVREILSITGITIKETGIPGKGARFEMLVPKGSFRFGKTP